MGISTAPGAMTGDEIVELTKRHTIFEWSAQAKVDPIPVAGAKGCLLLDARGQALPRLQQPADVREHRPRRPSASSRPSRSRRRRSPTPTRSWPPSRAPGSARSSPRSRPATSTRSSSPTAAPRRTRTRSRSRAMFTGRHKIVVRYRSYHGGTAGAITLTGDPRRWAAEPGIPGVVRVPDFHRWGAEGPGSGRRGPAGDSRTSSCTRARRPIAAIILETVVGTNGILIPPDGYMQGVREICDRYGILLDRRRGHGRLRPHRQVVRGRPLGRGARPDHDGQGPDQRLRAARRGRHAPRHRRRTSGTTSSTAG